MTRVLRRIRRVVRARRSAPARVAFA